MEEKVVKKVVKRVVLHLAPLAIWGGQKVGLRWP